MEARMYYKTVPLTDRQMEKALLRSAAIFRWKTVLESALSVLA